MKFLRLLFKILYMRAEIDFYSAVNKQWVKIKREEFDRIPHIGEKVHLNINNQHNVYLVVDVEHLPGSNSRVFVRPSKSLLG